MLCIEADGTSGGLALFWKQSLQVTVLSTSLNHIHTSIYDSGSNCHWLCTFIYANPVHANRRGFWNFLSSLNPNSSLPWALMGDFNEILGQHEKVGLRPHSVSRMTQFRSFLDSNGLMDLDLKGCTYTWIDNPRNGHTTKEKLDRVLVNWTWRSPTQMPMLLLFQSLAQTTAPFTSPSNQ